MLQENILLILSLLFAIAMLTMVSEKLKIAYPIFLVIAGLLIGFIPGIPMVRLHPDMVFLIFLPPLLYAAAWNTSWKDFWMLKRPISLLAVGLVIFTSITVAYISHAIIPGFPLAYGFLLGGIISPPDAVAATSVLENMKIPKRVINILEGESLINDASSLTVFRFALAAILTGQFTFWEATGEFFLIGLMGAFIGLAVAFLVYLVHKWLPTSPSIDTVLTLISPYIMYILAEHFHYSGVLAVVSGGLFLSYQSHEVFSYNSRIQVYAFWDTLVFLLNGLVFILIGLQLPQIIAGLGQSSLAEAIYYAVVISVLTIVIRIIWVFPGAYLPRILSRRIRKREQNPGWRPVFVVAWSGMRGVVSLASALAIPLTLTDGSSFPHRNLLLFITFTVILFTLVLQGLTLPWLARKLNVIESGEEESEQQLAVKLRLAEVTLAHMKEHYQEEINTIDAYTRLKDRYERMVEISNRRLLNEEDEDVPAFLPKYRQMLIELVSVRRKELLKLHRERKFSDEMLRNKEWELDLEEARLQEQ